MRPTHGTATRSRGRPPRRPRPSTSPSSPPAPPARPQIAPTPARVMPPVLSTAVLVVSALAVTLGERAVARGSQRGLAAGLAGPVELGVGFVGGGRSVSS